MVDDTNFFLWLSQILLVYRYGVLSFNYRKQFLVDPVTRSYLEYLTHKPLLVGVYGDDKRLADAEEVRNKKEEAFRKKLEETGGILPHQEELLLKQVIIFPNIREFVINIKILINFFVWKKLEENKNRPPPLPQSMTQISRWIFTKFK